MRYNYLDIIKKAGFLVPKSEERFDEYTYTQIVDQRERELNSIVMLAFHNMKYCGIVKENILLFQTPSKEQYHVYISKDSIIATLQKTNAQNSLFHQRDFLIKKEFDGSITFKQLFVYQSENIVLKTFVIDKPGYHASCNSYIDGYDKTTCELFRSSLPKDTCENYLLLFAAFLNESGIVPDISRKITIMNNDSLKIHISETDNFGEKVFTPIKSIEFNKRVSSICSILESYIRARNFDQIITMAEGLSDSIQNELALKLNLPQAIYNYLLTLEH